METAAILSSPLCVEGCYLGSVRYRVAEAEAEEAGFEPETAPANKGAACPVEMPMTCHFQWHLARQRPVTSCAPGQAKARRASRSSSSPRSSSSSMTHGAALSKILLSNPIDGPHTKAVLLLTTPWHITHSYQGSPDAVACAADDDHDHHHQEMVMTLKKR